MAYYEQLENGRFKCLECPKTYANKGNCKRHFRKHTGEKFDCEFCNYNSTDITNLQKHIRTHTGEKPFECQFCEYKATVKTSIQTHINSIHYKTTHTCHTCHHEFTQYNNLYTHLKKGCLGKSSKSRMELLVSKFLDQHNVIATYNKTDEWMVEQTGFRGRFDFVVDTGDPLFIELDGRQHFEPIEYFGGQKTFEKQQRHDDIKNNFCRDNGFKLLRFRYDDTNEYIIGTIMLHLGMF